jgi:predicted Zn-dependent protease
MKTAGQWVVFTLAGVCVLLGGVGGCTKNAATGEKFLNLTSRQQEISMGVEAAPGFTQEFGGKVEDAALQAYVSDIGRRLAAVTEADNPGLPWEFTLLDSDVLNAFALPGGKVFVTRGLAKRMTNEAQLAGVLGHEVGHVTAQHAARRISNATLFQAGMTVAAATVSASGNDTAAAAGQVAIPALNVGGQLVLLKFGREEESQADYLGMRYMSRIGYNPKAQVQVMQILADASKNSPRQPEWLATHPLPETRIQRTQQLITGEYAAFANDPKNQFYEDRFKSQFLARLNTLPPPKQKAELEVQRLMELAAASNTCCGQAGPHAH